MKPERFTSSEAITESLPQLGEGMLANMAQIVLAQDWYLLQHNERPDMTNPEIRRVVGMEWAVQCAAPFRNYVDSHMQESFDINDEGARLRLLEKLTPEEETLH